MNTQPRLSSRERQDLIREVLAHQATVTIPELAESLKVSEMSIRRDLDALEANGEVKRTHGGATVSDRLVLEFDYRARQGRELAAKRAIAREASRLVKPGDRLILDTGTTTHELARLIKDIEGLTVVTPSLPVASELQFVEGIDVILLGGVMRQGNPDLTGAVTEHCLDLFAVDMAFQGADAICDEGYMYTHDAQIAQVDRKIRSRADRHYILADSTKFGRTALVRNGHLREADLLITDDRLGSERLDAFKKMNVNLRQVRMEEL